MRSPKRTLRRDLFEQLLEGVPGIDKDYILKMIYPGPDIQTLVDFPGIDRFDQKIFEMHEATAVLKEFLDLYFMGKFIGPFPM